MSLFVFFIFFSHNYLNNLKPISIVPKKQQEKEKYLFYQILAPKVSSDSSPPIRGKILILHSLHEHGGRYIDIAKKLVKIGFICVLVDLYGHGLSGGKSGSIDSFDTWYRQLKQFFVHIMLQNEIPNDEKDATLYSKLIDYIPFNVTKRIQNKQIQEIYSLLKSCQYCAVMGMGIGGNIAIYLSQFYDCSAVLIAPLLKIPEKFHSILQKFASGVAAILGDAEVIELSSARVGTQEALDDWRNDPLVRTNKLRAKTAFACYEQCFKTKKVYNDFNFPFLLLQGTDDKICDMNGAIDFYNSCQSKDKNMILYDGDKHDLLHDLCADLVCEDLLLWLLKHS